MKEKGVKAIFFITGDFAKAEPELVQRMIDEGHVVGNHSWKHPLYSGLSVEEAEQDLMKLHDYVKENFNYEMRYFRFPAGNFSERALAEVQQLGYKSLFWSFAYKDWLTDDQPDEAQSLKKIVDSACPGMIYLLHAVSKTNADILADVIDGVTAKGSHGEIPPAYNNDCAPACGGGALCEPYGGGRQPPVLPVAYRRMEWYNSEVFWAGVSAHAP